MFLDITASIEKRETLVELVSKIVSEIDIPFTVGGGINSVDDVRRIIRYCADKISLNSLVYRCPKLSLMSKEFGSQCVWYWPLIQNSMDMNGKYMSKEGEKKQA